MNNGHVAQINVDPGTSHLTLDGDTYDLVQFHFHASSEHTVNGNHTAAEMHLVHKDAAGKLAVVGILLDGGGADSPEFATILDHLPASEGEPEAIEGVTFNPEGLLPAERAHWAYDGSLTTPPCTEGVSWFVMSEVTHVSDAQIAQITSVYDHNFRPTQSLNDRKVEGAHFTYEGPDGPDHWGDLSPAWATCEAGTEQSPIDIVGPASRREPAIEFTYADTTVTGLNNGHVAQVNIDPGTSHITYGGQDYDLLQFHFHAESEHTVNGVHAPAEMHLVHRNAAGQLAVVGVMLDDDAAIDNPEFATILPLLPTEAGAPVPNPNITINPDDLLPAEQAYWTYQGSLTTPPCSEGVTWLVMWDHVHLSAVQLATLTAIYDANARPTQPLNARHIDGAHFEYEGVDGPEHWGDLSPQWGTCATGQEQSPLDIPAGTAASDPGATFNWQPAPLRILNNGHTVQVNVSNGSQLQIGADSWDLVQFHYHAHSEHTVGGQSWPLELHFVHRNGAGELAVVGVLVTDTAVDDNPALAPIVDNLPAMASPEAAVEGVTVDLSSLLPAGHAMWRYAGSLTTPPCSEGVKWHVLEEPIEASPAQVAAFEAVFDNNARPAQDANGRAVQ